MGHYPSTPKNKQNKQDTSKAVYVSDSIIQDKTINLSPLSKFQDSKEYNRFLDSFYNQQAGINTGNSIMQHSDFLLQRMSYQECSTLSTEPIINNAIGKLSNEIFRKGFNIICDNQELKEYVENRINEIKLNEVLHNAFESALIYGGVLIYIDRGLQEGLDTPLYITKETAQKSVIKGLKNLPPHLVGASKVEMFNPLHPGYMKPELWQIAGTGLVHSTRLINLSIFKVTDLILPMFNFFGISLCQLMKEAVRNTNTGYNSIADILLRFKTDIITSDLLKINPREAIARAEFINKSKNNLGTLLLTKDEIMQQFVTSLAGLDKVIAQLQESVAISARMPAVKLLGLTPSGFNATGDYDLNSFYDELASIQQTTIKPIIERICKELALEFGVNEAVEIEFEPLKEKDDLQDTQALNLLLDSCLKGIEAGIITQEQALSIIKNAGFWNEIKFEAENDNLDFDLDLGLDNEK